MPALSQKRLRRYLSGAALEMALTMRQSPKNCERHLSFYGPGLRMSDHWTQYQTTFQSGPDEMILARMRGECWVEVGRWKRYRMPEPKTCPGVNASEGKFLRMHEAKKEEEAQKKRFEAAATIQKLHSHRARKGLKWGNVVVNEFEAIQAAILQRFPEIA